MFSLGLRMHVHEHEHEFISFSAAGLIRVASKIVIVMIIDC